MKRLTRKNRILQRLQKKNRKQETPVFERLEPRLLLNADITGLSPTDDPTTQTDNEVEADIMQSNSLLLAATTQTVPYSQNFSAGKPTEAQGWEYYSDNQGQIQVVGGHLLLDDSVSDWSYSLNEAILHLDLTDKKEVTLTLDHTSVLDENHAIPTSFSGHYKGDGIALSVDGINWIKITDLTSSFVGTTFSLDSIIELAKAAAGSNNLSDVRIKFQQYDNSNGNDGREFDNIQVNALTVQQTPYTQDFSSGQPTANQGWEYYSDNQGQIQVIGGRLRMDDSVSDWSYSSNEAILHVDLTGQAGVKLTLDHYSLADEINEIPVEFTGHYKGDGISISVDGIHWVRITNLNNNFTGQVFELDAKIAQAKALAGTNDVSNVRIKFQQYDNSNGNDGREFDNISVTSDIVAQVAPYTQKFSSTLPTASQGWEYYSTNQGQIQVTGGRLRLDDSVSDWSYSSNEAILHVDLTNLKDVTLTLDHFSLADEDNGIPATYSGHYKGDAISLSVDGINWIRITNLTTSFTGQTFTLDAIIEQAKTAAGSTDVSNIRIKFQQYDNSNGNDGREFDNIVVTGLAIQDVPYVQTFDSGKPVNSDGWEYYSTNQGQIQVINGYLLMDDSVVDYSYSSNEAILHVDLTNKKDVVLSLDHTSYADENDALPASFSGHHKGDGIAISVDGVNWITVTSLTTSFINQSFTLDSLIEAAKTAAGSNDVSDVRIKFQQYDNSIAPLKDGRSFDNINITATTVQDVPYTQNFEAGMPTINNGWEFYSDNQGQIQVVDGKLRMDDSVSDWSYSSNEAILHVNLTDKTNVTLTLDHTSLSDENDALPASFTGHYKGDGISLSVDGINWVKITDLTTSFTEQSFSLDSIIALAKIAAGSTDVSNVRIKFQQYDNSNGNDGREFDNINITANTSQTLPYNQDFSTGLPSAADGWEYYSDNQGQIQVVSGALRLDDYSSDYSYSLNEAILHLDMTGKTNVTLTLDHTSISDENDALAASFTGHYKGDGISLSVDGFNWIKVTDLTTSFTGQSFSLDTIIAQAVSAAGSSDLSDVQIKFQQYDNSTGNDGREFDNIQITST
ncbi:MAG: LEPR-XLL domain-containing protein [Sedimentisphaerales bacterium]|nr:LEPR-XLL domain-containing protein [Sedimentisphaerales bacterium]